MSKVYFDISMSLDGFVTAAERTREEPLGRGGERLHDWAFNSQDERNRQLLDKAVQGGGAVICGRRTYDDSMPWWGTDGPTGAARLPVFVVTHSQPSDAPKGGVYTFVTGGIHSALEQAKKAAGAKDVTVMGGADIAQQYIRAGLVDEISLHVVPVLFGDGLPLFANLDDRHIWMKPVETIVTPEATHLRYRLDGQGEEPADGRA